MTEFEAWTDDFTTFVGASELPEKSSLMKNQLRFSDLNLSSVNSIQTRPFEFEGKFIDNQFSQGNVLTFYLKLVGPSDTHGMCQFVSYVGKEVGHVKVGDIVDIGYPESKRMINSNLLEIFEQEVRKGITLEFAQTSHQDSASFPVYIFQLLNQRRLCCCAVFKSYQENFSDTVDSLGADSDSIAIEHIDAFDINELDHFVPSKTNFEDNISRKRSFLHREDVVSISNSASNAKLDLYSSSLGPPPGLKKLRSARNLQQFAFPERPVSPLISRSSAFSAVNQSNLARCASAPAMKANPTNIKESYSLNEMKAVFLLLSEVTSNGKDMFVKVMSKFLLSDKETLTKVIQKELCFYSRPEKVFSICYQFISKNFPPFKLFQTKLNEKDDAFYDNGLKPNIAKLGDQQFDDFAMETNIDSSVEKAPFVSFNSEWRVPLERRKHLKDFYLKLGFPDVIASCYEAIESKQSIKYNLEMNTLVIDKQEKLFTPGKQRYVADGQERPWMLCNPMLQQSFNFKSVLCRRYSEDDKFSIERTVVGGHSKMTQTYEVSGNETLEVTYCLYKANVKADEDWTLVYSTLVVFEKL